ncbi:hypothetical protein J4526_09465 [Desulfurococcaceae archaeon MEX13E-LK6-19]|nr:hypothetical protein J4526_09465 [Desulfurococcaceae archaeon MEX13E-LK6-19]
MSQYIICRSDCPPRFLEALAMNGLVDRVEVIDCDKKRFKKLRVILIDGTSVESQCRFEEEITTSLRIIASYIGLLRLKKMKEKIRIIKEAKKEE